MTYGASGIAVIMSAYLGEHMTRLAFESDKKYSISACVLPVLSGIAHRPACQVLN